MFLIISDKNFSTKNETLMMKLIEKNRLQLKIFQEFLRRDQLTVEGSKPHKAATFHTPPPPKTAPPPLLHHQQQHHQHQQQHQKQLQRRDKREREQEDRADDQQQPRHRVPSVRPCVREKGRTPRPDTSADLVSIL
jgi:hypothetical protein